jgi:hypothetical protein
VFQLCINFVPIVCINFDTKLIRSRDRVDAGQIATLARQMYPNQLKFLVEAFEDATRMPYGYLSIDLKAETEQRFRIRANIFPDERQYVYVPI